jgi:hypothetical protein
MLFTCHSEMGETEWMSGGKGVDVAVSQGNGWGEGWKLDRVIANRLDLRDALHLRRAGEQRSGWAGNAEGQNNRELEGNVTAASSIGLFRTVLTCGMLFARAVR